ncbi:hypothetical protein Glove_16g152 [Diversispora epigaea]|uniref:Uncharacterized protein n=1 Tax=Diversispora epigaea TaxID=1348612 RepID=A0A397JN23_9GLOM|nr:hypothetical protein Glove_16g152 [Diversispora epigaea]
MTEVDIKSVINETIVKAMNRDNINADLSQKFCEKLEASTNLQELRESIKTATKSFTEQLNTIRVVSSICRQVRSKKILISLSQLLKIVKPKIHQEIINSIANPDIAKSENNVGNRGYYCENNDM